MVQKKESPEPGVSIGGKCPLRNRMPRKHCKEWGENLTGLLETTVWFKRSYRYI